MGILAARKHTMTLTPDRDAYINGSLRIKEILGIVPATALPMTSDTVMGMISFRGKKVPVLDFRVNSPFGDSISEQICIVQAENGSKESPLIFGALVDSEEDAYDLVTGNTH